MFPSSINYVSYSPLNRNLSILRSIQEINIFLIFVCCCLSPEKGERVTHSGGFNMFFAFCCLGLKRMPQHPNTWSRMELSTIVCWGVATLFSFLFFLQEACFTCVFESDGGTVVKNVRWGKSGRIRTNPGAMGLMGPMRFRNTVMEVFLGPITPVFCHNGTSGDILFRRSIVKSVFRGLHNGEIYPAPRYI